MAADLTGIINEGEFFSQHYLDEILERDVKEALRGDAKARRRTARQRTGCDEQDVRLPYAAICRRATAPE